MTIVISLDEKSQKTDFSEKSNIEIEKQLT